jgi:hypothetical protein
MVVCAIDIGDIWGQEIEPLLKDNPGLEAKAMFHRLK